ncbi:MAG: hypothetical protein AABX84_02490, partial [Nanoarchaeota archaeon]
DNTTKDNIQKTVADKSASQIKKPNPEIREIIDWYSTLVFNTIGIRPEITGKHAKIIQTILTRHPKDTIKKILYWFLDTHSEKFGIDLSTALSTNFINEWKQKNR